jgi:hypothetical protein
LDYRVLKTELFICQLPPGSPIPQPAGEFFSITGTAAELSVICEHPPPDAARVESGWSALEILGPLDFALTGILASFAVPLAEAGIPIFAISTFDTDYLLVKTLRLEEAIEVLSAAGHKREG